MNRMTNKTLLIIIGILLVSNIGFLWMYFPKEKKGNVRTPVDYMVKELDLDKEQALAFGELWEASKLKNKPVYDSLRISRDELYKYLNTKPIPDSIVEKLSGKIGRYEQKLAMNNFIHFRNLAAICDSSQRIKLDSVIQKMGRRGGRKK